MGLLERLIAEGAAAETKKAEEAKNNPIESTPSTPARVDSEEARLERVKQYEERERKIKEWEAQQDPDRKVVHAYRQADALLTISCPACSASRDKPCTEIPGEWGANYLPAQARNKHYSHLGRIRTFATCQGIHTEELLTSPYREWPYASKYRRWAIFKTSSSGGETKLHKRPVKKFKVFDDHERAAARAKKAQDESQAENLKKNGSHFGGDRYGIAPVIKVQETWTRWDLAHEGLKETP